VGQESSASSIGALKSVLQRGCEAVERMRPALAQLMGPCTAAGGGPDTGRAPGAADAREDKGGVAATAGYARQLIDVACEEVSKLCAIKARLELLADASLYAASMAAQLADAQPAAAGRDATAAAAVGA
jgi:hypothetical protein